MPTILVLGLSKLFDVNLRACYGLDTGFHCELWCWHFDEQGVCGFCLGTSLRKLVNVLRFGYNVAHITNTG